MTSALIGYTGFVGGNLARQMRFDELYNSKNIEKIKGRGFDLVVCAGAPGAKWYANEHPIEDLDNINRLLSCLAEVSAKEFVLISTVDAQSVRDWYGNRRSHLEVGCCKMMRSMRILRLPALFGQALRKNALYDLLVVQRLDAIAPNATYQWYPLKRLGYDIKQLLTRDERFVVITSEPIAMEEIRQRFFPRLKIGEPRADAPNYDVKSYPAAPYALTKADVFGEMGAFIAGYA